MQAPSTVRPLARGPRVLRSCLAGHCPWVLVWAGACYWHGVGEFVFDSSSSRGRNRQVNRTNGPRAQSKKPVLPTTCPPLRVHRNASFPRRAPRRRNYGRNIGGDRRELGGVGGSAPKACVSSASRLALTRIQDYQTSALTSTEERRRGLGASTKTGWWSCAVPAAVRSPRRSSKPNAASSSQPPPAESSRGSRRSP